MSILTVRKFPDKILKKKAATVETFDKDLKKLAADMAETMYESPGVGLAAPQVGVSIRMIVVDAKYTKSGERNPIVLVNPVIVEADGELVWSEGCLSCPDFTTEVERYSHVVVEAQDVNGKPFTIEAAGDLLAIVLQHEIDHLDGTLIVDKVSQLKRQIYRKKRLKELEQSNAI